MPRFTDDELIAKALLALEEVYRRAEKGPIEPDLSLRFLLAFLANHMPERWPVDQFWKAATSPAMSDADSHRFGRHQTLTAALKGVYVQLGRVRS